MAFNPLYIKNDILIVTGQIEWMLKGAAFQRLQCLLTVLSEGHGRF